MLLVSEYQTDPDYGPTEYGNSLLLIVGRGWLAGSVSLSVTGWDHMLLVSEYQTDPDCGPTEYGNSLFLIVGRGWLAGSVTFQDLLENAKVFVR